MVNLSIIIVNYKGWSALKECLDSLTFYKSSVLTIEVIIVDNCSNDGNLEKFEAVYKNFLFIKNSGNNGFANGCNIGAKKSRYELLLFLNPDTVIFENSLDVFVDDYLKNPEIAALSCLQIDEKNNFYRQKNLFPSFVRFFGFSRGIHNKIYANNIENSFRENDHFFYPDWITGAVVLINKSWFNEINGWNENYWMYMEDVDLCKKLHDKNGIIAVTKNCTIFHKHGGASRINILTKALTKTEVIISKHVYISQHFSKSKTWILHLGIFVGTLLEKILLTILSLFLFWNDKLKVNRFMLKNYTLYIFHVMKYKTFVSPRSVPFKLYISK